MKDIDLRGIALSQFYEQRTEGYLGVDVGNTTPLSIPSGIEKADFLRVCAQLGQAGLIEWKPLEQNGIALKGVGRIRAAGVDVVEGGVPPPIPINIQHITVSHSTGVQIAGNNSNLQQTVTRHIEQLIRDIESIPASPEEKQKTKSKLAEFLNTPVGTTLAGGALGALLKLCGM